MPAVELRGVSWDHPRGHDCMVATAEAYRAVAPDVRIIWETRSLQDFADFPVQRLAERYDLLVIDHPFVGFAAGDGCLLPLDRASRRRVPRRTGREQRRAEPSQLSLRRASVGAGDRRGRTRLRLPPGPDRRRSAALPKTWDEVLALAAARRGQERAQVANPLIPIDALMSFCSICAALDAPPYQGPDRVVDRATGREALGMLRALADAAHPASLERNPPRTLDLMSTTDEIAFVPLLFGYSNYARPGFRPALVRFTGVPTVDGGDARGGILGGAGVAISARTKHPEAAAAYAAYVASPDVQRGVYFAAGGQPGHRAAWQDEAVNAASSDFFADTLAALDRAYLRPRYLGFMEVQERSGEVVHAWLAEGGSDEALLDRLDELYRESEPEGKE